MTEATYVLFAHQALRARLRDHLNTQGYQEVRWRERRRLFGSEFFLTGPSREAREAHHTATVWLYRTAGPI